MKFGPVAVADAEGAILAHATVAGDRRLRKAHRLTGDDIEALRAAGIGEVVAVVLAPDDVDENAAATRIAEALRFRDIEARPAATGRVNLHALVSGIFTVDKTLIDRMNLVDPRITIATMPAFAPMLEGQMVATIKIIPFAVPEAVLEVRLRLLRDRIHQGWILNALWLIDAGVSAAAPVRSQARRGVPGVGMITDSDLVATEIAELAAALRADPPLCALAGEGNLASIRALSPTTAAAVDAAVAAIGHRGPGEAELAKRVIGEDDAALRFTVPREDQPPPWEREARG